MIEPMIRAIAVRASELDKELERLQESFHKIWQVLPVVGTIKQSSITDAAVEMHFMVLYVTPKIVTRPSDVGDSNEG